MSNVTIKEAWSVIHARYYSGAYFITQDIGDVHVFNSICFYYYWYSYMLQRDDIWSAGISWSHTELSICYAINIECMTIHVLMANTATIYRPYEKKKPSRSQHTTMHAKCLMYDITAQKTTLWRALNHYAWLHYAASVDRERATCHWIHFNLKYQTHYAGRAKLFNLTYTRATIIPFA